MKKAFYCLALALLCIMCVSCNDTASVSSENVTALLESDCSYQDVVDLLGPAPRDVGSGAIIYEWDLEDDTFLRVWVSVNGDTENERTIDHYEISKEPFHS